MASSPSEGLKTFVFMASSPSDGLPTTFSKLRRPRPAKYRHILTERRVFKKKGFSLFPVSLRKIKRKPLDDLFPKEESRLANLPVLSSPKNRDLHRFTYLLYSSHFTLCISPLLANSSWKAKQHFKFCGVCPLIPISRYSFNNGR